MIVSSLRSHRRGFGIAEVALSVILLVVAMTLVAQSVIWLATERKATERRQLAVQEVARWAPLDRILVETDSPDLAPVPMRGKPCEPAYVVHTAAALAGARGMPPEDFARATTANFFRLFGKVPKPGAAAA